MNRRLSALSHSRVSTPRATSWIALAAVAGLGLAGCSSISDALSGNKVDYRTGAARAPSVEAPPDLTQLQSDPRYQRATGQSISANEVAARPTMSTTTPTPAAAAMVGAQTVALNAGKGLRIERSGDARWIVSDQTPEQLWPVLQKFWETSGFKLVTDNPATGVMETDWSLNRSKLPQDFLRRTIGRVLDNVYDTGERDRYRTRLERVAGGTEIHVTHRGIAEEYVDKQQKTDTRWLVRPRDPSLEAEMLAQILVALRGGGDMVATDKAYPAAKAAAEAQVAAAPAGAARARVVEGRPAATLQVDSDFESAWRRVGQALDRGGFTVEDRDRKQGLYYVRYVDPKLAGQEEPNIFAKLFGAKRSDLSGTRYQVAVQTDGKASTLVAIQDDKGAPQATASARTIVEMLVAELR